MKRRRKDRKSKVVALRRKRPTLEATVSAQELTQNENSLLDAIKKNPRANRAFRQIEKHGYPQDLLVIHLTMWAKVPNVLFEQTLRSKIPNRKSEARLFSRVQTIKKIASEMESDAFQLECRKKNFLERHWLIKKAGDPDTAKYVMCLPATLRIYSKLLNWQLETELELASAFDHTHREYSADQTRGLFDNVKTRTGKDRVDSVCVLLNFVAKHFELGARFEKKALSQQLKRLRAKASGCG